MVWWLRKLFLVYIKVWIVVFDEGNTLNFVVVLIYYMIVILWFELEGVDNVIYLSWMLRL